MRPDKNLYYEIGLLLKTAREQKNISLDNLSIAINGIKTKSTLKRYEDGKSRIDMDTLKKICEAIDLDYNNVINEANKKVMLNKNIEIKIPSMAKVINILVYGNLCCGNGLFVDDEIVDSISIPASLLKGKNKEYFAQYAKGDSMIDANIKDGDLLIFEKTNVINPGEIGCFCIGENLATCKRYNLGNDNSIYLLPANSKYSPIRIDITTECFKIIGKLLTVIAKV